MCQTPVLGIYFQLNHLVRGHRRHQSVALSTETLNSQRCAFENLQSQM